MRDGRNRQRVRKTGKRRGERIGMYKDCGGFIWNKVRRREENEEMWNKKKKKMIT